MIIKINEYSDVPIYMQIRNQIVMGISSGELKPNEQLPTVRALALDIGINTMTVSKSYQILKSEGYILTDRKNGARVRPEIKQSGELSEENKNELKRIISEAKISGIDKTSFKKYIDEYWS
ncbi:MAG: GntR family transcriptional regulator [Lachnospiraceae bacterium]|nr:GntR family transcriptional regulator [Lachnospiraceae bacterium]